MLFKWLKQYTNGLDRLSSALNSKWPDKNGEMKLMLYNTNRKRKEVMMAMKMPVTINRFDSSTTPKMAKVYVCGPTVYDDCHLGHAFTYMRFDILRRVVSTYCGVDMMVAMSITDIDDKILNKAVDLGVNDYRELSNCYFNSFVDDMKALNIIPPHFYLKVTDHIQDIINFIQIMQDSGTAYINDETNDVNFDSSSVANYKGVDEIDSIKSKGKRSPRDFSLWKASKPNEPKWLYKSNSGRECPGRPGWHVECSAMASGILGSKIDLHFGGKDLMFPHHYNEAACCHVYHNLKDDDIQSWSNLWLHSGHLILNQEKMSKSLGNVIKIKDFMKKGSANTLRMFCVKHHYRADITFDDHLIEEARKTELKLKSFLFFIKDQIFKISSSNFDLNLTSTEIPKIVFDTETEIMSGICDDLNLNHCLEAIFSLFNYMHSKTKHEPQTLIMVKLMIEKFLTAVGLDYGGSDSYRNDALYHLTTKFRNDIRIKALKLVKSIESTDDKEQIKAFLNLSDELRDELRKLGFSLRDDKSQ